MKELIKLDGKVKAELPGNMNRDDYIRILRIYLFNEEFGPWKHFEIEVIE